MYSEKVLDHFTNPRNVGELPDADGVGEVGNARCGDIMKMYLKIDGDTITDVKFKTFGCGAAIAASLKTILPKTSGILLDSRITASLYFHKKSKKQNTHRIVPPRP